VGKMVGFVRLSQVLGPTHYCECEDRERNLIGRLNVKAISCRGICSVVTLADTCKCMDGGTVILNFHNLFVFNVRLFFLTLNPSHTLSLSTLFNGCEIVVQCFVFLGTLAWAKSVVENDLLASTSTLAQTCLS